MKTLGVKTLVRDVLDTLQTSYTDHVIEDVFQAIELDPKFLSRYQSLCDELGKTVVNNWCGQWVAHSLSKTGKVQVPSRRSSLIGSYSLLDADAATIARKPNEIEVLQMMSVYYRANKDQLPAEIRSHRDAIVELMVAGVSAHNAFSAVMRSDTTSIK